jgi:hypothetical protein
MGDRRRYDSAMFWLAFGTAAAVIGIALMTIGVARSAPGGNLVASLWFDGGLVLLAAGGLLLLWALALYLARRRDETHSTESSPTGTAATPVSKDWKAEPIRGYYSERKKMLDMWGRQQRSRQPKK